MKIFSSSSSSSPQTQFPPLIPPSLNPNITKFLHSKILPIKALLLQSSPALLFKIPAPPHYNNISKESAAVSAGLEEKLLFVDSGGDEEKQEEEEEETKKRRKQPTKKKKRLLLLPTVRRPKTSSSGGDDETTRDISSSSSSSSSSAMMDVRLSEFAKKMPIFEPANRVQLTDTNQKPPLGINLELALYRAKVLGRNYQFEEAKQILQKCLQFWPEDGRLYVALGKIFSKQLKTDEARSVYERGCQATQGENPYIWQCWAVLEDKMGNIRRARELFDAATAADKKHIAAWHGWAVLELKQGNIKKARNLLSKGLKYSGGNEYVYQTLALLEAKANRVEQARYLFKQATKCNPKSCASWLAWAQLEMQQENHRAARQLFERAVQASPKNRFAWHVWGMFEASLGDTEKGRKLFKIGHALNPRDPVLLQSLALLEYKYSTANLARVLFRRASELDPRHQPVWIAWGWMEWKEGNISTARELYQRALSIDSTTESAARCLQAWGVLEQRIGNLSAARRLFRSSLNVNSQSYVTWMTWASLEEEQGNFVRAEEIRDLYFQQRTEVVDDASWVMGFLDIIDPTLEKIKRLLNFNQNSEQKSLGNMDDTNNKGINNEEWARTSSSLYNGNYNKQGREIKCDDTWSNFDLDTFMKEKLFLNASKLEVQMETFKSMESRKFTNSRSAWTHRNKSTVTTTIPQP